MKRLLILSSLITLACATLATQAAEETNKASSSTAPVAKVNGKPIPAARAEVLFASLIAQGQTRTPELEAAVREDLVRREVLAQEALKKGIDKKSEVQAQLELARQGVLIGAYLNDFARSLKISDAELKKEYEGIKAALGDKEYKARHILVEKEEEAKEIIEKLKKGEKFEELAKVSKDPGSKDRGGELGWANKASYVPEFSAALTRLEKGKYTETPVRSNFGWHIIQLDDVRELKAPPFEEVKAQILQRLRHKAVEKHILELRGKAKIE